MTNAHSQENATTDTVRDQVWQAIVNVRDAAPRLSTDADTEDIIDAILDSGIALVPDHTVLDLDDPDTDNVRDRVSRAINNVRDAAPRHPGDADTDDIIDAILDTKIALVPVTALRLASQYETHTSPEHPSSYTLRVKKKY